MYIFLFICTRFIFYLHGLLSKFHIFLDAHIIIYRHLYVYMMIGVVFDGFSIKIMLCGSFDNWSLKILWSMTLHVDLLHPINDLGSGVNFSLLPIDICPRLALILVDDGVRVGELSFLSLLNVARCLTFNMCPFDFWKQKWEPIWLFWQSLEAYCVKVTSSIRQDWKKITEGNLGLVRQVDLWLFATFCLCCFGWIIRF